MSRIRLVPASIRLLEALQDDLSEFARLVGSPVPEGWPEFPEAIGFTLEHLKSGDEDAQQWSMHFFIDAATGALVGSGGYATPPEDRTVEIGYEVAPAFRGRGLGSGAARALVDQAVATGQVDRVIAHTLPGPNPSTGVLASLGFKFVAEQHDSDEGTIWEWSWSRSTSAGRVT